MTCDANEAVHPAGASTSSEQPLKTNKAAKQLAKVSFPEIRLISPV